MQRCIHLALLGTILCPCLRSARAGQTGHFTATIIYDNYVHTEGLRADWGFACLIRGAEETILFDTGMNGQLLLENMAKLALEPGDVDVVVISHFHGDHIGGVEAFLERNPNVTVYAPAPRQEAFAQQVRAQGAQVIWVDKPLALCRDVYLTGTMGEGIIEQSLILDTEEGSVVITGCSHPGIVEILRKTREILDRPIYMAFGGFHLSGHSEAQLRTVIEQFKELGVARAGPSHCTGDQAIAEFRQAYGDRFLALGVGRVVEMPQRRVAAESPRIAMLWASVRGDRSVESMARHDLIMAGAGGFRLRYAGEPTGLAEDFTTDSVTRAKERIAELRRLNPDAVILCELPFYEYPDSGLPEDHVWWLRKDGQRQQFWPGTHRMDWSNAEYRRHVVKLTAALRQVGFDGVFYDNLRDEPEPWVAFLKEVRQAIGDEFLILANAGYAVGRYDFATPYLNGMMYESGWSHARTAWDDCIAKMQHTQSLLREPKISVIERFEETRSRAGWPSDPNRGKKPPADPQARRWSLCYALTIGDFYYLFSDNTSHNHDWYPEYDVKIGLPTEPGEKVGPYTWQRRYRRALVVVNLPGAIGPYEVKLDQPAKDSLTGRTATQFAVAPGDGAILVREE